MRKVFENRQTATADIAGGCDGTRRPTAHAGNHHRFGRSILKAFAISAVLLAPAGCSMTRTIALEDSRQSEPAVVTASVTKPVEQEGIDSTDAEVIKTVVAQTDVEGTTDNALAWSNPDTGSSGTIMAIDKFVGSHGQKCKKFQTTVDTFMGISLYDGETCEMRKGFWVLSWLMRKKD